MKDQEILRTLECSEYVLADTIKLRKIKESDTEDMYEYTSNPDSCIYLKWEPHTQLEQAHKFILERLKHREVIMDLLWGIELIAESKLIGVVRIYHIDFDKRQAEISYIINPFYSGKGYATIAVKKIIAVCFHDLNFEKIIAFYVDKNEKSKKLLKHCGAVDDKEWDDKVEIKNKIYNIHRCVILKG